MFAKVRWIVFACFSCFCLVLTNEMSIAFVNVSVAKCWHGSRWSSKIQLKILNNDICKSWISFLFGVDKWNIDCICQWQCGKMLTWFTAQKAFMMSRTTFSLWGPCLDLTMPAPAAGLMPHDSLDPAGSALCPTSLGQSDQVCELWQMEWKFHKSLTSCEDICQNVQWVCEFWQMECKFHVSLLSCCVFHCNSKCPGGASTNVASDGAASLLSFANKCASGFACKQMGLRKMEISKKAVFFTTKTSHLCKK